MFAMREPDDVADLVVVDRVDDRHDQRHVDAVLVEVLDRPQLDVVEVADLAVLVVLVADAVELEVRESQPGLRGLPREVRILGEADSVGRALHREVAELARVADRGQEVRRERRLPAGELHRELPPRLDRGRVVEQLLDVLPLELVDVTHLVRVHEARVAHHVAAVRQVDREDRAAPVLDRGRPVLVEPVLRNHEVAARIHRLQPFEEGGVGRHDVFEAAVLRAFLAHQDPAALFDDLRGNLAGLALDQDLPVGLAGENLRAHLRDAARTERIGLARKAERREAALALLQQRRRRPLRLERSLGESPVERARDTPQRVRSAPDPRIHCSSHADVFPFPRFCTVHARPVEALAPDFVTRF